MELENKRKDIEEIVKVADIHQFIPNEQVAINNAYELLRNQLMSLSHDEECYLGCH